MQYVNALSPPIAGERVGVEGWVEMGTYWRLRGLQYQTHMQAPKYDVQFLRSEALRSSSSSSRTRQIEECYIAHLPHMAYNIDLLNSTIFSMLDNIS